MGKEFDYYIFIDYSVNIIGYMIVERCKVKELLCKITKFGHYKELKNKSAYLHTIKKIIEKTALLSCLLKLKIREMRQNIEIYSDVLNFLKMHGNCLVLISVDNHEYSNFRKLVKIVEDGNTEVKKESELKKGTPEYRMSLVLDTLLNIERLRSEHNQTTRKI